MTLNTPFAFDSAENNQRSTSVQRHQTSLAMPDHDMMFDLQASYSTPLLGGTMKSGAIFRYQSEQKSHFSVGARYSLGF